MIASLFIFRIESNQRQLTSNWDVKEVVMRRIIPQETEKQVEYYFSFNSSLNSKVNMLKAKQESYPVADHHIRGECDFRLLISSSSWRRSLFRTDLLSNSHQNRQSRECWHDCQCIHDHLREEWTHCHSSAEHSNEKWFPPEHNHRDPCKPALFLFWAILRCLLGWMTGLDHGRRCG